MEIDALLRKAPFVVVRHFVLLLLTKCVVLMLLCSLINVIRLQTTSSSTKPIVHTLVWSLLSRYSQFDPLNLDHLTEI
jgi:hypothetical protein